MGKYTIYISTFGKKVMWVYQSKVIEVGAANRIKFYYNLHDDIGINISDQNEYYGELTGLYWVWKNAKYDDNDIIGFCHYNKSLFITKRNACRWLRNNPKGIITAKPIQIRNHPVADEVEAIVSILKERSETQFRAWRTLYDNEAASKGKTCRGGNMFITTGKVLNEYCEWLFSVLIEMRSIVGDKSETDAYMRRYCAFMGERLLSVYIEFNNIPAKGVRIRYKKWWLMIIRPVVNILHINQGSSLYLKLKKLGGYESSYK